MLTKFVLLTITQSPIRNEVDAVLAACENGIDLASGDPAEVEPQREICRVASVDLANAIGASVADPEPYQERALGAWRVFDVAIYKRGSDGLGWTSDIVKHAANDVQRLRFEVAQQAAYEAQP